MSDSPTGKGFSVRLSVKGCGRSSLQNVNTSRVGAGEWNMAFQAPGESLADTVRQRAAMQQVMESARTNFHRAAAVFALGTSMCPPGPVRSTSSPTG